MKVCVAFDYMKLKVKDIEHLEKFTPALTELYRLGDIEEKAARAAATAEQESSKKEKRKKENKGIRDGSSEKKVKSVSERVFSISDD